MFVSKLGRCYGGVELTMAETFQSETGRTSSFPSKIHGTTGLRNRSNLALFQSVTADMDTESYAGRKNPNLSLPHCRLISRFGIREQGI